MSIIRDVTPIIPLASCLGQDFEPKAATVALDSFSASSLETGTNDEEKKHEPSECDRDSIRRRSLYSGDPLL
jgi:hypothetical protein